VSILPRIRRRRFARREDESSLYYIIERDLDREALFPENDGWIDQVQTNKESRHKIDYVVEYDGKLCGIEVKFDYPKEKDFAHVVDYYEKSLNAVFLAYPADRVGEAILITRSNPKWKQYGLIAIALFRSHCVQRARILENRVDNYVWSTYFDKNDYLNNLRKNPDKYIDKVEKRQTAIELAQKLSKTTLLRRKDWKLIALVLELWNTYGVNKFHHWETVRSTGYINGLNNIYHQLFSEYPDWSRLERIGVLDSYSYGSLLNLFAPSNSMLYFRNTIEKRLSKKYPKTMKRLMAYKDIGYHRKIEQNNGSKVLFLP
jgi:hypothetical protein